MARERTEDETTTAIRGTITTAPAPIPPIRNKRRKVRDNTYYYLLYTTYYSTILYPFGNVSSN